MEANIGGLTARVNLNEGRVRVRLGGFLGLLSLALLSFFGIAVTLFSGLRLSFLPVEAGALAAIGVLGCAGFVFLGEKKGLGSGSFVIAIAVVLALFLIFGRYVENAWLMIVNRVMDTLSLRYGRIFPEYAVTLPEEQLKVAAMLLLVPLSLLLSMLSAHLARAGSRIFMPAFLLCALGAAAAGLMPFDAWMLLPALGVILAAYRHSSRKGHSGDSGDRKSTRLNSSH